PFVLFLSFGPPHFPHDAIPPQMAGLYRPEEIWLPPNVPPELTERAKREAAGYYTHIAALDRCVGELVATLEDTGLATRTILVFTSDHGEMMGSHGCPPFMKQVAWNESAHVPFLLRYPAAHGHRGRVVDTPVTTPDILPTLLGLAGVRIPESVEGEDLSDLVRAPGERRDRAALYMGVAPFIARQHAREYRALRTARFTYVRDLNGPWMLFDDERDPYQLNNLVGKPRHAALVREMETRLQAALRRIGDDFKPRDDYVRKWGYELAPHGSISYERGARPQSPRPIPPDS
ncbi:MAG: sulfatase-like hydrolase/transferase, partial [Armatimonadota bacterium]|nr:sulfatase-like hydrolase/transferase [Armatimonadota bacterium]